MIATALGGLDGAEPLDFLAALGVQVVLEEAAVSPCELSWPPSAGRVPVFRSPLEMRDLVDHLVADRDSPTATWLATLRYPKVEKKGVKPFAGCRPPLGVLRAWVDSAADATNDVGMAYLAALFAAAPGEPLAADRVPAEPTARALGVEVRGRLDRVAHPGHFDFTSRNVQLIDQALCLRQALTAGRVHDDLVLGRLETTRKGRRMGWDPWASRPFALSGAGAQPISPVREWLAFRALRLFTATPSIRGTRTTACIGRRKRGAFIWPIWADPLSSVAVGALLASTVGTNWTPQARRARGVRALFKAELTKGADGYAGVFAPAAPL